MVVKGGLLSLEGHGGLARTRLTRGLGCSSGTVSG